MTSYGLKVDTDALKDIEEISNWYNGAAPLLGRRFKKELKQQINLLKINPFSYSIRYSDVHCMLMRNFPFMAHYRINEENREIIIFAVIHTSRNPKIWEERSGN